VAGPSREKEEPAQTDPAASLTRVLKDAAADPRWLERALIQVASDPASISALFPAVGRRCGRGPLRRRAKEQGAQEHADKDQGAEEFAGWTVDDAARVLLLTALPLSGPALAEEVSALYRYGDAAEKRAVLRALPGLGIGDGGIGDGGIGGSGIGGRDTVDWAVELLRDAIRSNDPRLVAAALGPYASHLDDEMWRQAVLKCVFMDIPLTAVAGLTERADGELGRMLAALAEERRAAGRTMPPDATALLAQLTKAARLAQAGELAEAGEIKPTDLTG